MTHFTVQVLYAGYYSRHETVEAETLDEACVEAVEAANQSENWKVIDEPGPSFVYAAAEGEDVDPLENSLPIPRAHGEYGLHDQPQIANALQSAYRALEDPAGCSPETAKLQIRDALSILEVPLPSETSAS
mgnify:CR=1 FL=1|tara:strand:- start:5000 stop:5392 length:393 start_codon:yes stop_codon:yes gene_type:complete